jgi:hypothetical protein
MHLDIILNLRGRWTLATLLGVLAGSFLAHICPSTQAYTVVLPEAPAGPIFLNFSLLPTDSWTYVVRNVWGDAKKIDSALSGELRAVVWWDDGQQALCLDPTAARAVSSSRLTVIIEAKSASFVSLIPVTMQLTAEKMAEPDPMTTADYPHIIQIYRTDPCGSHRYHPMVATDVFLNITNVIPQFVRQSNWRIRSDRVEQDFLVVHDNGAVWAKPRLCVDLTQTAYHTVHVDYDITGGAGRAAQAVDLIFAPSDAPRNSGRQPNQPGEIRDRWTVFNQAIRHRQRRHHRRSRASTTSITFSAPSYTVFVVEELAPPVYVVRMNVSSSSKAIKFSMAALADSRSQALFSIDAESGVVRTETQLDREAIAQHFFRITAVSQTDSWTTATTTLHIKVLDVNDNLPVRQIFAPGDGKKIRQNGEEKLSCAVSHTRSVKGRIR